MKVRKGKKYSIIQKFIYPWWDLNFLLKNVCKIDCIAPHHLGTSSSPSWFSTFKGLFLNFSAPPPLEAFIARLIYTFHQASETSQRSTVYGEFMVTTITLMLVRTILWLLERGSPSYGLPFISILTGLMKWSHRTRKCSCSQRSCCPFRVEVSFYNSFYFGNTFLAGPLGTSLNLERWLSYLSVCIYVWK